MGYGTGYDYRAEMDTTEQATAAYSMAITRKPSRGTALETRLFETIRLGGYMLTGSVKDN